MNDPKLYTSRCLDCSGRIPNATPHDCQASKRVQDMEDAKLKDMFYEAIEEEENL